MELSLNRNQLTEAALKALHLIDLTSLNDDDTDDSIAALAASADTPVGTPAALCVYPRFVGAAHAALARHGLVLPVATVANFPHGAADPDAAARETADALARGADEIDVVFPYRSLIDGDERVGRELVAQCRAAAGGQCLKVILETGELRDAAAIRRASEIAIEEGADFLKTSTGKVAVNATLDAAAVMLATIRVAGRMVGFKAAGGVRTAQDAAQYLSLAERELGSGYLTSATFRFGASGLLGNLLETLGHRAGATRGSAY